LIIYKTTTYAICAYHHWCCVGSTLAGRCVQHNVIKFVSDFFDLTWEVVDRFVTLGELLTITFLWFLYSKRSRVFPDKHKMERILVKVCQWLATGRWFSPGTPVSSINKTDHHDIADILLKVASMTIKHVMQYKINTYPDNIYAYISVFWPLEPYSQCLSVHLLS
jgi:hypothetical protein